MRLLALLCLGPALLLSSCVGVPYGGTFPRVSVVPPPGLIYTAYKAPLMTNLEETPTSATKTGKATSAFVKVLYFDFAFDNASLEAAARDGGITKIHHADYEFTQVNVLLFAWGQFTTTVYGE